jgi:hypothetical protein
VDNGLPPVIWPTPPENLPSIDPDQIPAHPDLPDLKRGFWSWVINDDKMCRCFITQTVTPGNDLPGYRPEEPPEAMQPGEWVVVLIGAQRPAWGWIPTAVPVAAPK